MKEISGINHLGLRVRDLETARAFYEQLGFVFLIGPVGPEPVAVVEHPSGVNINFILNGDPDSTQNVLMDVPKKETGFTHVALEVTSADSAKNFVSDLGIAITEEVEFDGAKFFFIRDPDGNVIEFHQPAGKS